MLIILILIISSFSAFSQSNEILDRYLEREEADGATTLWLVYVYSGSLSENSVPADAMNLVLESRYGRRFDGKTGEEPVRYGDFAAVVMDELDIPGGLFYMIFRSPRYAAREFTAKKWMPGNPDPFEKLSPWQVLTSLAAVSAWKEEQL